MNFTRSVLCGASVGGIMIGVVMTANPSVQAAAIPAPYAHWKLDELSGTTAYDSSGNGNGTYHNDPTLGEPSAYPSLGTSVKFDDSQHQRIKLTANDNFQLGSFTNNFTITAWVYNEPVTRNGDSNNYILWSSPWWFGIEDATSKLRFKDGSSSPAWTYTNLERDKWYFVAVTIDSSNKVTFYINGQADGKTTTFSSVSNADPDANFDIGGREASWDRANFSGNIDDVQFFTQALSGDQIQQLYQNAVPEPGSVGILGMGTLLLLRRRRTSAE